MNWKRKFIAGLMTAAVLCTGSSVYAEEPETLSEDIAEEETAEDPEVIPEETAEEESDDDSEQISEVIQIQESIPEAVIPQDEAELVASAAVTVGYDVHLSHVGWIGETPAGVQTPEGRIEAIRINLSGIDGDIIYQAHVQSTGWMNEVSNGAMAGTTGRSYQTEAIRIRLNGAVSEHYDVWYRTDVDGYGWTGWAKNGNSSGSQGYSKALRSIEIRLLEKNDTSLQEGHAFFKNAVITMQAHVGSIGWMSPVPNGAVAGTTGQSRRLEALRITLSEELAAMGDIQAEAHVQSIGWMPAVSGGAVIGTTGQSKRIEAIRIRATGQLAEAYDIYYRAHVQSIGWLDWTANGGTAGTTGYSRAVEALEIVFEPKGFRTFELGNAAALEYKLISYEAHTSNVGWQAAVKSGQTAGTPGKSLEALIVNLPDEYSALGNIRTEAHVQNTGWMNPVYSGETAGTTGKSLQMEGVKINLTGALSNLCDVYYRVYVKGLGWLGWTKNGGLAGSEGCSRAIEAIQIDVVHKKARSYSLSKAYTTLKWNDFTDVNSILLCANKKHKLPAGYEPADLVVPNVPMNYSGTTMRREAASALERMFAGARNAGITLRLGSGYRSEAYQRTLYNGYVAQYGAAVADTISSRPGYSDHQTGLAADISDHDGRTYLTEAMENTPEGRWLRDHAHEYGFIMRYPKGKQAITGYAYEPWHFRYVGVSNATAIYNVSVWYTFEEYFGVEGGDYY